MPTGRVPPPQAPAWGRRRQEGDDNDQGEGRRVRGDNPGLARGHDKQRGDEVGGVRRARGGGLENEDRDAGVLAGELLSTGTGHDLEAEQAQRRKLSEEEYQNFLRDRSESEKRTRDLVHKPLDDADRQRSDLYRTRASRIDAEAGGREPIRRALGVLERAADYLTQGMGREASLILAGEGTQAKSDAFALGPMTPDGRVLSALAVNMQVRAEGIRATTPAEARFTAERLERIAAGTEQRAMNLAALGRSGDAGLLASIARDTRAQALLHRTASANTDALLGRALAGAISELAGPAIELRRPAPAGDGAGFQSSRDERRATENALLDLDRSMREEPRPLHEAMAAVPQGEEVTEVGRRARRGSKSELARRAKALELLERSEVTGALLAPFAELSKALSEGDPRAANLARTHLLRELRRQQQLELLRQIVESHAERAQHEEPTQRISSRLSDRSLEENSEGFPVRASDRTSSRASERISSRSSQRASSDPSDRISSRSSERPSGWYSDRSSSQTSDQISSRSSGRISSRPSDASIDRSSSQPSDRSDRISDRLAARLAEQLPDRRLSLVLLRGILSGGLGPLAKDSSVPALARWIDPGAVLVPVDAKHLLPAEIVLGDLLRGRLPVPPPRSAASATPLAALPGSSGTSSARMSSAWTPRLLAEHSSVLLGGEDLFRATGTISRWLREHPLPLDPHDLRLPTGFIAFDRNAGPLTALPPGGPHELAVFADSRGAVLVRGERGPEWHDGHLLGGNGERYYYDVTSAEGGIAEVSYRSSTNADPGALLTRLEIPLAGRADLPLIGREEPDEREEQEEVYLADRPRHRRPHPGNDFDNISAVALFEPSSRGPIRTGFQGLTTRHSARLMADELDRVNHRAAPADRVPYLLLESAADAADRLTAAGHPPARADEFRDYLAGELLAEGVAPKSAGVLILIARSAPKEARGRSQRRGSSFSGQDRPAVFLSAASGSSEQLLLGDQHWRDPRLLEPGVLFYRFGK